MQNTSVDIANLNSILGEYKDTLAELQQARIKHAVRTANLNPDKLAKMGLTGSYGISTFDCIPFGLETRMTFTLNLKPMYSHSCCVSNLIIIIVRPGYIHRCQILFY